MKKYCFVYRCVQLNEKFDLSMVEGPRDLSGPLGFDVVLYENDRVYASSEGKVFSEDKKINGIIQVPEGVSIN